MCGDAGEMGEGAADGGGDSLAGGGAWTFNAALGAAVGADGLMGCSVDDTDDFWSLG